MLVAEALEEFRYSILNLSPKTQSWYLDALTVFASWCAQEHISLEKLRAVDIRRYLDEQRKRINPRTGQPLSTYTVHGYAESIKVFLNFCVREEGLDELVSEKLPRRIEMPKVDIRVIPSFTDDQIRRLLGACSRELDPALAYRNRAIVSVLLDTGCRAGELGGLTLDAVHITPYDAFIRVFGKGRHEREIGLGKEARAALHKYITRYRKAPKEERHVFISQKGKPLTVSGLGQLIQRLGEWARVDGTHCHRFRHTFATRYLAAGGDIYKLSRLLGHASVSITENYLRSYRQSEARKDGLSVLDQMK